MSSGFPSANRQTSSVSTALGPDSSATSSSDSARDRPPSATHETPTAVESSLGKAVLRSRRIASTIGTSRRCAKWCSMAVEPSSRRCASSTRSTPPSAASCLMACRTRTICSMRSCAGADAESSRWAKGANGTLATPAAVSSLRLPEALRRPTTSRSRRVLPVPDSPSTIAHPPSSTAFNSAASSVCRPTRRDPVTQGRERSVARGLPSGTRTHE